MDTEIKLKLWRDGQTSAERLAANVLHLDGFSSVDPQCPLGGPDGLKDIICNRNGWNYVGAAYFPGSEKQFEDIKDKFIHDLAGVEKNKVDGIVFVTNQPITPTERTQLIEIASDSSSKAIIYHLERIRLLLDSPSGYGLRLEYLDIDMSREEQLSFFSQWNRSFSEILKDHGMMVVNKLSKKIDTLKEPTELLGKEIHEFMEATRSTISAVLGFNEKSNKSEVPILQSSPASSTLTLESLCMLHRALLQDHPHHHSIGKFRENSVWIGGVGSTPETASYVPPKPEEVIPLTQNLLDCWRNEYTALTGTNDKTKIVEKITKFHYELLKIHPFIDGNGQIARFLLMQQANELLNHTQRIVIEDRKPYFDALELAGNGDFSSLQSIITQAIYGVEFIAGSPCQMSGQQCPACGEGDMNVASNDSGVQCAKCGIFIPAVPLE